ncbi:MAG: aryldialkylphosphatase, partial [Pseudomonadota bacterium]|nr:aryldialkylphosphatase [Pseudomonadota bacterium]
MTRLTRSDLIGKAQTFLGLIDSEDLGPTLMHEHLLWDIRTPKMQANPDQGPEIDLCNCWHINYGSRGKVPRNLVLFDRKIATQEVAEMRQA